MKDLITDAIRNKLAATLESVGGAKALYGDPIDFNGEQIIPVARVMVSLAAGADGSGGGNAGLAGSVTNMAKGGGGGKADASVNVTIEPVGYLRSTPQGPVFCPLMP
ncbi:MAG: hypothetical protein V2I38_10375 [Alcanivoracaceae bacterium]|nr:hypothetical protein [Alcanivoracaceae bacterium]